MATFTTKNGSKLEIFEDGYLSIRTNHSTEYGGYLVNNDTTNCQSPLGRMVLRNAYKEYQQSLNK